jgi:outer membrane protein assembly factor BamD
LCFLFVIGCTSGKENFKDRSVSSIYKKASTLLQKKEYSEAASEYKDLETLFPYSSRAQEGQIMAAYCYFMASKYMDAKREIAIFLRYHPSHKLVPYALYLKAMCLYMQVASIGRDSKRAMDAKQTFLELINKFPDSIYYVDALKRVMILDDIIAAHEMMIGRYYQTNKSPLAAIGRYTFVATALPHTDSVPEAYFRMVESCLVLGLDVEAEKAYDALAQYHPLSLWTKKAALLMKKN